jgi:sulfite dehydrogenase (cytochrome) subunit A
VVPADKTHRLSSELKVRATSNAGEVQPMEPRWNPAGYLRNVVETVRVTAA